MCRGYFSVLCLLLCPVGQLCYSGILLPELHVDQELKLRREILHGSGLGTLGFMFFLYLNPHVRTLDTTINETAQTTGY